MSQDTERIRVLLIDDEPTGLSLDETMENGRDVAVPQFFQEVDATREIPELEECFDLRWLATAEEIREFRDLSLGIGLHYPMRLGQDGWVPEIICFDYALTRNPVPVADRGMGKELFAQVSPLPSLRELADRYSVTCSVNSAPRTGTAKGEDNLGCFSGGLVFAIFADHPCAPVALTRKGDEKTANTEAGFFEWMLENQSHGTFQAKGRPTPRWDELIPDAVSSLRRRIEQLASASVIQISLDDLLKLLSDHDHKSITISSRYGRRQYPIDALFVDYTPEKRRAAVVEWVTRILSTAWAGSNSDQRSKFDATMQDLIHGRELAEKLWGAYNDDDLFDMRVRLSELVARRKGDGVELIPLKRGEKKELDGLLAHFGVKDPDQARPSCTLNYVEMRHPDFNKRSKRWAILLAVVRLLQRRCRAVATWRRLKRKRSASGKDNSSLEAPLEPSDLYLALFPIAQTPVILPWHTVKGPSTSWKKYVTELGLDIQDIIDGVDGEIQATPQESNEEFPAGVQTYERIVLRMFAESVGFSRQEWESDALSRNVLLGTDLSAGEA